MTNLKREARLFDYTDSVIYEAEIKEMNARFR